MSNIDIKSVREELVQALSRKFDDSKKIAVYGAGDTAERWFAPFVRGDVVPNCFIDDTPGKAGTFLYEKPVISLEEAHVECKGALILLASIVQKTRETMADTLRKDPIEDAEVCLEWEEYVFCKHSDEVLAVFDMLEDECSKRTYANMILTRMGKTVQNLDYCCKDQYFAIAEFAKRDIDEVFVDCGGYVGDTIEQYLNIKAGVFEKIVAFEPFERSFRAMSTRTARLVQEWGLEENQIELVQAGVGEEAYKTELKICERADGQALSPERAHGDIPVIALDNYFAEQKISFLKADIEGYEWNMLHGVERVIRRDRPKLAICMYHTPFDMYRLALKIRLYCPDYKFAVRQHYCDILETVLYAYV